MSHTENNPCRSCIWSRPLWQGLVACCNENSKVFRQIRVGRDTCHLHRKADLLDRAERIGERITT